MSKDNKVNMAYIEAFSNKETMPIVIPIIVDEILDYIDKEKEEIYQKKATEIANICDALILTGGTDINPTIYNEENYDSTTCNTQRDKTDLYLTEAFIKAKKPIMGICRGMQLLGIMFRLPNFKQSLNEIEELHNGNNHELTSRQEFAHKVNLKGKLKEGLKGIEELYTNSFHHQGFAFKERTIEKIKKVDAEAEIIKIEKTTELNILANTDFIIEAFEHKILPIFAVQWHPEEYGNKSAIINYFINQYLK